METINVTANTALDTDLNLSGGVTISGADSTYTLNATVYYKNNGATFIGVPQTYSGSGELTYNFANGTVMTVDMTNSTWSFQRLTNELGSTSYEYDVTFTLKGSSTVSDTVTVKPVVNVVINKFSANTLDDSVRNYDYQPAYPVQLYAGSPEKENTAWAKYIEEIKRIYRLYNENMNYYESMTKNVLKRVDDFEKLISSMASNTIGVILPFIGDINDIPTGWALCNGENGTPDLTNLFLMGWNGETVGENKEAGLPNITGSWWSPASNWQGAVYEGEQATSTTSTGTHIWSDNVFDASRSNPIYGNSTTVQPPAYTVYYIMKVADAE